MPQIYNRKKGMNINAKVTPLNLQTRKGSIKDQEEYDNELVILEELVY